MAAVDALSQIAWLTLFVVVSQWLGWRLKIPAIVFLLGSGVLAGPVFGLIMPEVLLGGLLQPVITLAVGIILFEGSIHLNFRNIREARNAIRHVILIGGPVVWALTALAGFYIAGLSWPVAVTFGALLIVTGPTVILPLLKNAHLKERPASILKWEGIINDSVGAVLAVLCYEFFRLSALENHDFTDFFAGTVLAIVMIGFFGLFFAWCVKWLFNRDFVPEYLKPAFLLGTAVVFFALCNSVEDDFGLIGVTILGVALANLRVTGLDEIRRFKETLSILLVSGVFILLTANINPAILLGIDARGLAFIAVLLFAIRPVAVFLSHFGTTMSRGEVLLTGWIAPRGIVCAAVAGVLGPAFVALGYEDGNRLVALAFAIVIATVLAHSLTVKPLARKLGLAYAGQDSLIVVGASAWAVSFAEMLRERGLEVIIADKNWHALRAVRLADISVYYGEILSDETEYHLELARYNMLLAATDNPAYNALVCNKFIHEFGRNKVWQFLPHEEDEHERRQITGSIRGRTFGPADMDYWDVQRLFTQGWRFRAFRLGPEARLDDILDKAGSGVLRIMGSLDPKKRLNLSPPEDLEKLEADHVLIVFEQPASEGEAG